jgi:HlyD family secretion protein
MKKKIIYLSLAALVIAGATFTLLRSCGGGPSKTTYETATVSRGTVRISVTATGTIQAIQTVEVGTQVSGKISKIYADFNSNVKAGQLLAELDRKPLLNSVTIAEAALDNARAEMTYQAANFSRVKALADKQLISASSYDEALFSYQKAQASLKSAQLNYDQSKINLDYAFIYSPIDGVVLQRAVNEGQTVAASFSTPTLFTIANDLTRMQVEASIDEADIGYVKEGQTVNFTVDAFPDDVFAGTVTQVRLKPTTISNVVTYTVIVQAPNPELKLMPGMTASITCTVKEALNVPVIPSQALQFSPDSMMTAKAPPMPRIAGKEMKTVWVKTGGGIRPVTIGVGIDDDVNVQVTAGLKEGDEVVIAAVISAVALENVKKDTTNSSPFMPTPPKGKNAPPPPGG